MLPHMKPWFALLLVSVLVAKAHDPFEIASVVYLQSNRFELMVEMEFATGVILSRSEPSQAASADAQFESVRLPLEQLMGGLLEITAGSNAVVSVRTNVQRGMEPHIRGQLELTLTDHRPLRFSAPGLRAVPDAPYRIRLTVLDMVNRKVLGQTILFADSAPVDFPATMAEQASPVEPTPSTARRDEIKFASAVANDPLGGGETNGRQKARLAQAVIIFAAGTLALAVWRRWRAQP